MIVVVVAMLIPFMTTSISLGLTSSGIKALRITCFIPPLSILVNRKPSQLAIYIYILHIFSAESLFRDWLVFSQAPVHSLHCGFAVLVSFVLLFFEGNEKRPSLFIT